MKLLILSDIHGNLDALHAIRESYDELWVLGDIVNYGPEPREALEAVRATASIVVQGNHDHAVGHCDDSRWSARFREVAEATRRFTSSQLSGSQKAYLRSLPVKVQVERQGVRFYLTHATPSDHHYGRIAADSDDWVAELERLDADVLLVGHSHVPFIRRIGGKVIVNPGSVGQPRSGDARASYAVWDDALTLERHTGRRPGRTHDGVVIALRSNIRWCSDHFELACRNGDIVRVLFAIDACDREVMGWLATSAGISGEMVRDLTIACVERRFGISKAAHPVEWLSDNGSAYIAKDTLDTATALGLKLCFTPVRSPVSNGIAEAFVKTFKRDYARLSILPDAETVIALLPAWFEDYNEVHPHSGLKFLSPREFLRLSA